MAAASLTGINPAVKATARFILEKYRSLHVIGKVFMLMVLLFYIFLGVMVVVITPSRIAQALYDMAELLATTRYGWLGLGIAIIIISFPPFIGHTTLCTLAGFAYGMKGFFIGGTASIIGSALAFVVLRLLFSRNLRAWSTKNEAWQALESVVTAKGLALIILIRVSPFPPWVYSNSLFASIQAVQLWQFVIATCFVLPKILLQTFIGFKVAELSDGKQRGHMDTSTKILDVVLIMGGISLALFASWTVYNLVQNQIKKLEGFSAEVDESATEGIGAYSEEAPLLTGHTSAES